MGYEGRKVAHNEREGASALRCHFVVRINQFNFVRDSQRDETGVFCGGILSISLLKDLTVAFWRS